VLAMNPSSVEFHLTDNDVMQGRLNGHVYDCDYSVHLPEYWNQQLIDPCSQEHFQDNLHIYKLCIDKGLSIRNNFSVKENMKVILHPGGAGMEKVEDYEFKSILYHRLASFYAEIELEFGDKIELLIENMPPLPWFYGGQYYGNIFSELEEIHHFCSVNNIKICLDISHLGLQCNYAKTDLIDSIKMLLPHTRQIHIADALGTDGEGMPIGEGNIDFNKVMEVIKDIDCAVIPEQMWGHKNNYFQFRKTITICNSILEGAKYVTNL
jgi:N-acetylneuraminate synthase